MDDTLPSLANGDIAAGRDLNEETTFEFDNLCDLCTSLFDVTGEWKTERRSLLHYDLFALASSASYGCHLCSLLLGTIDPDDSMALEQDLRELAVHPSEQLVIHIGTDRSPRDQPWIRVYAQESRRFPGGPLVGDLGLRYEEPMDAGNLVRSKAMYNCVNSTIDQIQKWIGQCVTSHPDCVGLQKVASTQLILPKRLLDLSSLEQDGRFRLVSTQNWPEASPPDYVTLSHCWGGNCGVMLDRHNIEAFEHGLQPKVLAQSFQDAILVTTRLGQRYLWIDALCIVQDSENAAEWRQEASKMGDIYANSYVTLAATASKNSHGGLFHKRNPLSVWPCRIEAKWTWYDSGYKVIGDYNWSRERHMKPLQTRAWAYQEWLLSKRLVHFSHDQVRWECFCTTASQSYPEGYIHKHYEVANEKKSMILLAPSPGKEAHGIWYRICEKYSRKKLTKPEDRLVALSGIARMVCRIRGAPVEDYCAGLWRPRLSVELLWTRGYSRHVEEAPRELGPKIYIAPTWSWASLNNPIDFDRTTFWELDRGQS